MGQMDTLSPALAAHQAKVDGLAPVEVVVEEAPAPAKKTRKPAAKKPAAKK